MRAASLTHATHVGSPCFVLRRLLESVNTGVMSRLIAQGISGSLGQPLIVDNRPVTAPELVSKAPPDGYTLFVIGTILWTTSLLQKTSYDPVRDFSPICQAGVNIGTDMPPMLFLKATFTGCPMRTVSRSQSTILVIIVTPSSSVT